MKSSAVTARRSVEALGARGKTTRIPDEVRGVVQGYSDEARAAGQSWAEIAATVGLSTSLLMRWNRAAGKRAKLKPVVITRAAASVTARSSRLVLVTAAGERLEGLCVEDTVRILRELR